jgi:hypothetical protein
MADSVLINQLTYESARCRLCFDQINRELNEPVSDPVEPEVGLDAALIPSSGYVNPFIDCNAESQRHTNGAPTLIPGADGRADPLQIRAP